MSPKEAIARAKAYVEDIFGDEGAVDLSTEEVARDAEAGAWQVTVGLSRLRKGANLSLLSLQRLAPDRPAVSELIPTYRRDLKIVTINDSDGSLLSIRSHADQE